MSNNKKKEITEIPKTPRNYASVVSMLQIFVLVSIAYSTYIVALGTQGYVPKAMLIPQALWAGILIVRKFYSAK